MSVDLASVDFRKLSNYYLTQLHYDTTPEKLQGVCKAFLETPSDTQFIAVFNTAFTIDVLGKELLSGLGETYARLSLFTGQSQEELHKKMLEKVIPRVKPYIERENQLAAQFWSQTSLQDRSRTMNSVLQFFKQYNYNPTKEQWSDFSSTTLAVDVLVQTLATRGVGCLVRTGAEISALRAQRGQAMLEGAKAFFASILDETEEKNF